MESTNSGLVASHGNVSQVGALQPQALSLIKLPYRKVSFINKQSPK
jgi:hypothetical protein